ncbi:MAG: hypothetical protein A3K19_16260 [Lentisphaerae bacterium RIFOXYB12_FULL_65_16]|nr:MAG: hypothetical protein A3K18_20565 [Lentisphaerae bacterium RIFOXYA12_64_32]OGV84488.1 MAG: hypothetical protein A3K19_16260 [Lentisphaerae bacterium RIFOXYB12_FULL_65_16]
MIGATVILLSGSAIADGGVETVAPAGAITNHAQWQDGKPVALEPLRRPPVESRMIYEPAAGQGHYSHHPHITVFKGQLFAMWSNGRQDEDAAGQRVLYAKAADFAAWSTPQPLVDTLKDAAGKERVLTAAGFHQHSGTLVGYVADYGVAKEGTRLLAVTTTDGATWTPVQDLGVPICPNHGPHRTASGRLIIAGNTAFPYTDDPAGLTGWSMTGIYPDDMHEFADNPKTFWDVGARRKWAKRLCEGSFYQTDDGVLHMLLRATGKDCGWLMWVTHSRDNGATWSDPEPTTFSSIDTKFHCGRLRDGRFYCICCPLWGSRFPLVLSTSADGLSFDRHYALGETHYKMKHQGRYKGGEYGYPHSVIHDGWLYAIVSRQKEAVEVLRVRLDELAAD